MMSHHCLSLLLRVRALLESLFLCDEDSQLTASPPRLRFFPSHWCLGSGPHHAEGIGAVADPVRF